LARTEEASVIDVVPVSVELLLLARVLASVMEVVPVSVDVDVLARVLASVIEVVPASVLDTGVSVEDGLTDDTSPVPTTV
jgi:hypothetical protein